jgi:SH3-like domain-containing protein
MRRFTRSVLFGISTAFVAVLAQGVKAADSASPIGPETTAGILSRAETPKFGASGLPLPRFASLKSSNVNLRVGPGKEHQILWNYVKAGLPVEIVLEFDNWRKIRDSEGVEGWVFQSMLTGKRNAIVEPWNATPPDGVAGLIAAVSAEKPEHTVDVRAKPANDARVVAMLEAGVQVTVLTCDGMWCSVDAAGHSGWVAQGALWGVYPEEKIDD